MSMLLPPPTEPILDPAHLHIAIAPNGDPITTIDSGLGIMDHPHFPGSTTLPFSSFDNAIDCLRLTIRDLELRRDELAANHDPISGDL